MKLLQVDFPMRAPFGEEMSEAFKGLAEDIAAEEGLIWKIWTENAHRHKPKCDRKTKLYVLRLF